MDSEAHGRRETAPGTATYRKERIMVSWIRKGSAHGGVVGRSLLVATFAFVACNDEDSTGPQLTNWTADLAGSVEFEEVAGEADVASSASSFSAAIEIAGAPADAVLAWTLMEGTCADPGDAVGSASSYPALEVGDDRTASEDADVVAALDVEGDYIVVVIDDSGVAPVILGCGALQLVYSIAMEYTSFFGSSAGSG
jgi:hypothetical protein